MTDHDWKSKLRSNKILFDGTLNLTPQS